MKNNSDDLPEAAKAPPPRQKPGPRARPVGSRRSFVREFLDFLTHNKKWWLLPIIVVLVLVSVLLVVAGSVPFIYTLF